MKNAQQSRLTRRTFLAMGATAAATASGAIPSKPSRARAALASRIRANETIRIGIVGYGAAAQRVSDQFAIENEHMAVKAAFVAASDVYAPRKVRAESRGLRVYDRWQDLVEQRGLDAIYVATPDHLHAPVAIAAMKLGKPVYLCAPMAHTIEDAKAIYDTAERTKATIQIGVTSTSEGRWKLAAQLLRDGAIGTPLWCQSSHLRTHDAPDDEPATRIASCDVDWAAFDGDVTAFDADRFASWRNYWDYSSGPAAEVLYSRLAPVLMALGAGYPERVSAAGGIYSRTGRESPDSFVMTAEYAGGLKIVMATTVPHSGVGPVVIRGTKGRMCVDHTGVSVQNEATRELGIVQDIYGAARGEDHLENWLVAIRDGQSPACDHRLGHATMAAIGLAVRAYRERRTFAWDAAAGMARVDTRA